MEGLADGSTQGMFQISYSEHATQQRVKHLCRFYEALSLLERRIGGRHQISDCSGRMRWPERGVYFFFEPGETRRDSGEGPRVVRIGTHALKLEAKKPSGSGSPSIKALGMVAAAITGDQSSASMSGRLSLNVART